MKRKLTEEDRDELHVSLQVLKNLAKPNSAVLKLHDVFEDSQNVHLIVEHCTGGDLFDRILQERSSGFNETKAAEIIAAIARFVDHCHDMSVVHRNIRPESFMFESVDSQRIVAIDFSACTFFRQNSRLTDVPSACSPLFLAPEMITGSYGKECDVWSMGVLLYILLSGSAPFDSDAGEKAIYEAILHSPLDLKSEPWGKISSSAKELVRKMLMRDAKRRFTVDQVLNHPWIKNNVATTAQREASQGAPEILLRIQKFSRFSALKKQSYRIMASCLPEDYLEGLTVMFEGMDKDGSGLISLEEMRKSLRNQGTVLGQKEVLGIINAMDLDVNSQIDLREFMAATIHKVAQQLSEKERKESLAKAFAHFDADGSGTISIDELRSVLKDQVMKEGELEEILNQCDRDHDSSISLAEFTSMMITDKGSRSQKEGRKQADTIPLPAPPAPAVLVTSTEPRASGAKKLAPLPKQAFDASALTSVLSKQEDASDRSSDSSTSSSVAASSLILDNSIVQV